MAYNTANQFQQFNFWNFQELNKTTEIDSSKVEKKLPPLRHRVKENSRLLPQEAIDIMTAWYDVHYTNPYPNFKECEELAQAGKVSVNQVKQWFVNVRRRTHNEYRKRRTNATNGTKKAKASDKISEEILNNLQQIASSSSSSDDSGFSNNSTTEIETAKLQATLYTNNYPTAPVNQYSNYNNYLNYQYYNNNNNMYSSNQVQYSSPKPQMAAPNYYTSTPSTSTSVSNYSFNSSYGDVDRNSYYYSYQQQQDNYNNYNNYDN